MKIFAKAALYLADECLTLCMGAWTVAFAVVWKWFGLLGLLVCSTLYYCLFVFFSLWCHLHLDDHLGRDIRHDDLYEELAPITHCKFNKKVHAHSPQLSLILGGWDHLPLPYGRYIWLRRQADRILSGLKPSQNTVEGVCWKWQHHQTLPEIIQRVSSPTLQPADEDAKSFLMVLWFWGRITVLKLKSEFRPRLRSRQ